MNWCQFSAALNQTRKESVQDFDIDKYSLIRTELGDEVIARALRAYQHDGYSLLYKFGFGNYARQARKEEDKLAMEALVEGKKHRTGCIHSDQPETVIASRTLSTNTTVMAGTATNRTKDGIATCIFFKHCDGVFKNIQGQRLPMRTQVEEAFLRRQAKVEAKRKREQNWFEAWLNNAAQELMMIWGKDEEGARTLAIESMKRAIIPWPKWGDQIQRKPADPANSKRRCRLR